MSAPAPEHLTCTFAGAHTTLHPNTPAHSLSLVSAESNLHVPAALLGGANAERIFANFTPIGTHGAFDLYQHANLLIGCASVPVTDASLADASRTLYRDLLTITYTHRSGRHHLYRVWNYVPHINRWTNDRENYREFCRGRSLAFDDVFHSAACHRMPAASAVGCEGESLCVMFVAGLAEPTHHENPQQTPAYLYPPEHGPRPPSFARATVVDENDRTHIFISGTASIKGHVTQHIGDLDGQITCTLDNLCLISKICRVNDSVHWQRHIKIYLRHAADLPRAQAHLAPFLRPTDNVIWLHSDICRANLDIEIELTLIRHVT